MKNFFAGRGSNPRPPAHTCFITSKHPTCSPIRKQWQKLMLSSPCLLTSLSLLIMLILSNNMDIQHIYMRSDLVGVVHYLPECFIRSTFYTVGHNVLRSKNKIIVFRMCGRIAFKNLIAILSLLLFLLFM